MWSTTQPQNRRERSNGNSPTSSSQLSDLRGYLTGSYIVCASCDRGVADQSADGGCDCRSGGRNGSRSPRVHYPDIDVARERALVEIHDVIVFHHPMRWYNCPALLKLWFDLVLTQGWAYGDGAVALVGPGRRGRRRAPPPTDPSSAGLPHSVPHLTGSLKVFCHERVNVTDGRRYRLRSSFIRSQFKHRRRLRRASHVRQIRMTW